MRGSRSVMKRALLWGLGCVLVGCGDGRPTPESQAIPLTKVAGRAVATAAVSNPPAMARDMAAVPVPARIELDILQSAKDASLEAVPGPRLVGSARMVPAAATVALTQEKFHWLRAATGGQVAALSVIAKEALGLRLGVQVAALPKEAILRVYSQARLDKIFQITGAQVLTQISRNIQVDGDSVEARTWWTPDMGSNEATLEIELPAGVPVEEVGVAIPFVSHIFAELSTSTGMGVVAKINEAATCNIDAVCDERFALQNKSVARMLFTSGGKTYICTGTLLNDAQGSGTPYFLSAKHCISTQSAASSLQTDWFYQSSACNSNSLSSGAIRLNNGAALLHASERTDISFMRLNDKAPAGAYFAGWDASMGALNNRAPVVGLHHPAGDMLKISKGEVLGMTTCGATAENQFGCVGNTGDYYMVGWSAGTTQGGSSGSALFTTDGRFVVGTLYGGSASCTNAGALDFYGRFDVSYNEALKKWLGEQSGVVADAEVAPLENILRVLRALQGG